MAVLDGGDDLAELGPGLLLLHPAVEDEIVEHLATASVLHHQIQRLFRLYHLSS